ncbi:MAG: hypothetical protein AAGI52_12735 [Bacteroidota bacterium]
MIRLFLCLALTSVLVGCASSPPPEPVRTSRWASDAQPIRTLTLPAQVEGELRDVTRLYPLTPNGGDRWAANYAFTLSPGQSASIQLESDTFTPYLLLLRDGQKVTDDVHPSAAQLHVSDPGAYVLRAGTFYSGGRGAFTLVITLDEDTTPVATSPEPQPSPEPRPAPSSAPSPSPEPPAEVRPLRTDWELGVSTSDALRSGYLGIPSEELGIGTQEGRHYQSSYAVTLRAGETLEAVMVSTEFDTFLALWETDSGLIETNDDDGSIQRSALRHTAAAEGTYIVTATSYVPETEGAFTISISVDDAAPSASSAPRRLSSSHRGELTDRTPEMAVERNGVIEKPADTFSVDLRAGSTVTLTMDADFLGPLAVLISPSGEFVADSGFEARIDPVSLTYEVPTTGAYTVLASTVYRRGAYTLTMSVE